MISQHGVTHGGVWDNRLIELLKGHDNSGVDRGEGEGIFFLPLKGQNKMFFLECNLLVCLLTEWQMKNPNTY